MTIYDYCAYKNPQGAAKVISSFGMQPVRTNPKDLGRQLAFCAKRNGGEALRRIILIHPDRELFEFERKQLANKEESKSNASGCGCSNANGEEKSASILETVEVEKIRASNEKESKLLSQNNLVIGGMIVLGLAIIMKK